MKCSKHEPRSFSTSLNEIMSRAGSKKKTISQYRKSIFFNVAFTRLVRSVSGRWDDICRPADTGSRCREKSNKKRHRWTSGARLWSSRDMGLIYNETWVSYIIWPMYRTLNTWTRVETTGGGSWKMNSSLQ